MPLDSPAALRLSIVLPTYNERENVVPIASELLSLADAYDLEMIFVDDDSQDGTADVVRQLAHRHPQIRLIRRVGRSGLSSAIKEGILDATGDLVVVMDCDGQHQPATVKMAVNDLLATGSDLVIGSRFHPQAKIMGLSAKRERNSMFANSVARFSLPRYRYLTDYMSGFFVCQLQAVLPYVRQVDVNGFKFLYELLAISRGGLRIGEVPLEFHPRISGESKLNLPIVWDLGVSILHTLLFRSVPRRAISFALVGMTGVLTHLLIYGLTRRLLSFSFESAQISAVVGAASTNFLINNILTFRSQQLHGLSLLYGLFRFLVVTSMGMVANVGVSSTLYHQASQRPLFAMFAGIAVDFVWKYAASSKFVWNSP
ncbi:MAG: glycosyltransferase family 2 protein [Cyanobacteriota bacterium]|nr:glycosyltransferase family 2 protein [Cyanobacteriota bacterium]